MDQPDCSFSMKSVKYLNGFTCFGEQGDALLSQGQLGPATVKFGQALQLGEKHADSRAVVVNRDQLVTVLRQQQRFDEALDACQQAHEVVGMLGEPAYVATSWHQIGVIHHKAGQFAAAQHTYLESLRLAISLGNRTKEASTSAQIASLHRHQGRLNDAAATYRKAIALYCVLGDAAKVSSVQYNLGATLHQSGRFGEAREALKAAVAIKMQLGHAAEPWNAWWSPSGLERDANQPDAAAVACAQAMTMYWAYRTMEGGATKTWPPIVVGVGKLLLAHGPDAALMALQQLHSNDAPHDPLSWIAILRALDAIVAGQRDRTLAEDPALDPLAAAELQLLLESLIAAGK